MARPSRDRAVTKLLQDNGFFKDKRSYVGMPLKSDATVHLYLKGPDKSAMRTLVFFKHKHRCVICGHKLDFHAGEFAQMCGAWHHVSNCDCVDCSELRCDTTTGRNCHGHRTIGFKRKAAVKDFNAIYGEE